ncbi:hypothetical protein F1C10_14315 [Sphingomonas sp. NBWT7]|uniref:hypothetical protein n=1 Tax=Sphingomonas sp. NBWT7 TaxID=2596913 RepID=UPI0016271023|nr:hypothetical protein [Sphingomonas sp. NBWT7]QNE32977.1 hypothetical protein F1C10_14315 [Sphingomonas sp. NBWT7]
MVTPAAKGQAVAHLQASEETKVHGWRTGARVGNGAPPIYAGLQPSRTTRSASTVGSECSTSATTLGEVPLNGSGHLDLGPRVVRELADLVDKRDPLKMIVNDKGSELASNAVLACCATFAERNQPIAERHRPIQPLDWESGKRIMHTKIVKGPIHAAT